MSTDYDFAAALPYGAPGARLWDFWVPTRSCDAIQALNRLAIATGSPERAKSAIGADYNGHQLEVTWNSYKGHYVAGYTWGGFNRLASGSFDVCLAAALRSHDRGQLGSSIVVKLRMGDFDALAMCRAADRLEPWSEEAVDKHKATWPWQTHAPRIGHTRIAYTAKALRLERQEGVPTSLFLRAESPEAWDDAVQAWRTEHRSAHNSNNRAVISRG